MGDKGDSVKRANKAKNILRGGGAIKTSPLPHFSPCIKLNDYLSIPLTYKKRVVLF